MIVWRGYGILVLICVALGYAMGMIGAEKIWGDPLPDAYRPSAQLVGMLIAAALAYGVHIIITRKEPPRTFIDKASGQEVEFQPKHDLFFIPVKFWPIVLSTLGVWFFFQR